MINGIFSGRYKMQVTGHRSQDTGHRKYNKKVKTLCWAFRVYLFVSIPVTSQSGICLASTMLPVVLRVKELNGESYTLFWMELEEFFLMFGCLETWK